MFDINQFNTSFMGTYLADLFERDLLKLRDEIRKFKDEDNLWRKTDGISNTAGTLTMHLVGSLNYSIGALLGGTGYVRHREHEFTVIDVPQDKLVADIEKLIEVVKTTLQNISSEKLEEQFPVEIMGPRNAEFYLVYFYGHLSYHLGQINYLRRILEG